MNEYIFWLVWNPDGHAPTVKHSAVSKAFAEADRLAMLNPGQKFFVMAAIGGRTIDNPVVDIHIDDIPF